MEVGTGAVNNRLAIRREDKNEWEARAPMTPHQVHRAIEEEGLSILVEESKVRAFKDGEYSAAGASVVTELSDADVILSIKEVPVASLQHGKVHVFFSHTFKGQTYNLPMLREIIDSRITLIDYEKITDDSGRRLVYFGNWAGYAGLVDTLRAFGLRKAEEGIANPFTELLPTYRYGSLESARGAMAGVGRAIRSDGLPEELVPLTIGVAGYGNVSRGVQEILNELPTVPVPPRELAVVAGGAPDRHAVYVTVFKEEDTVRRRDGGPFSLSEYLQRPEEYEGTFAAYLPHLSVLVNAVYWSAEYPRLVTDAHIRKLYHSAGTVKLSVIGDISCDIEGAVECTKKSTEPDDPFYVWNPDDGTVTPGVVGSGVVIMAVDNLPCELPKESTETFGESLAPFLRPLAEADFSVGFEALALPEEIRRAVIAHQGAFTPGFAYMQRFLDEHGV